MCVIRMKSSLIFSKSILSRPKTTCTRALNLLFVLKRNYYAVRNNTLYCNEA